MHRATAHCKLNITVITVHDYTLLYAVYVVLFGAAECYSDSSSTCEVHEDSRPEAGHQSRFCVSQPDRSVSNKGSYASEKHRAVMHNSDRTRTVSYTHLTLPTKRIV